MPARGKRSRYHHGDLRSALIDTAVELIGEQGVRGFSVAETSRRLGVAVSAPYAHFADRDELLAAIAVRAYEAFHAESRAEMRRVRAPAKRLAAMVRTYVRFADAHRPLFEVLFDAGLDKTRHPDVMAAKQPIEAAFRACVSDLSGADTDAADLAGAVEATAHGHAMLLLDGAYGSGDDAVEAAAGRAGRATLALIEGRHLLRG